MPTAPADATRTGLRPEIHGRFSTLPEPLLPRLGPVARARIVATVLWANLVCQIAILLTGGAVRLTGSGLGCSTWPNCEPGEFAPELTLEAGIHPFIEFGNRMMTGVLSIVAILVLLVSLRWLRHLGRRFLLLAAVPLIGTLAQAVIGGVLVLVNLHPALLSPHFLISLALVAVSTVLLRRGGDGTGPRRRTVPGAVIALMTALAVVGAVVLVLGTIVTGTGPHTGDDGDVVRILIDPVLISRLHALAVWAFCALLVLMLVMLHRGGAPWASRRAAWLLVGVTLLQGVIGYVQYFTGLPEILVALHLLGAGLFTAGIASLASTFSTRFPVDGTPAGRPAAPADSEARA